MKVSVDDAIAGNDDGGGDDGVLHYMHRCFVWQVYRQLGVHVDDNTWYCRPDMGAAICPGTTKSLREVSWSSFHTQLRRGFPFSKVHSHKSCTCHADNKPNMLVSLMPLTFYMSSRH